MNSIDRPMIPLGEVARALEVSTDVLKSEISEGNLKCARRPTGRRFLSFAEFQRAECLVQRRAENL